jgi:hypothetical protein
MSNCRNIYWNSAGGDIDLGTFLYQNQAQTIPASAGYYSFEQFNKWYQTDGEGLVLATGSCPNLFSEPLAVAEGSNAISCISGSVCGYIDLGYPSASFQGPAVLLLNPLQNVSGSTIFNSVPNGIYFNGREFTEKPQYVGGNSFAFTGSANSGDGQVLLYNDLVLVSPNTSQNTLPILTSPASPYTFEIWFKTTTPSSRDGAQVALFSRKQASQTDFGPCGWSINQNISQSGDFGILMNGTTPDNNTLITARTKDVYLGTDWKNIVITKDSTNNASGIKLYYNGLPVSSSITGSTIPNMLESNGISISPQLGNIDNGDPAISTQGFSGRIGRIGMFLYEAAAEEVFNNYLANSGSYIN